MNGNYDGNWQNGKMNGNGKLTLIKGPLVTKISGENWSDDDIRFGEI